MKCNQSCPGFELVSPCPFPTTIPIMPYNQTKLNQTKPNLWFHHFWPLFGSVGYIFKTTQIIQIIRQISVFVSDLFHSVDRFILLTRLSHVFLHAGQNAFTFRSGSNPSSSFLLELLDYFCLPIVVKVFWVAVFSLSDTTRQLHECTCCLCPALTFRSWSYPSSSC